MGIYKIMDLQNIYKKTNSEKKNIVYNWLIVYMPKIENWIKKSDNSDDVFDKYIALFIATNITYNIWTKAKNSKIDLPASYWLSLIGFDGSVMLITRNPLP